MYSGSITDISAIKLGHYTDNEAKTGCTVIIAENGAVCGVDVRGSAPGTRETDLMRPCNLVTHANAIMLSGGSAFGLEAACGAMRYLADMGKGMKTGAGVVPIVGSAVIYDLEEGSFAYPDIEAGIAACKAAGESPEFGLVGAGTGARVGKMAGKPGRGGIGSASITLKNGVIVAAVFVVNAVGDVIDHRTGKILSGATNENGDFINCVDAIIDNSSVNKIINTNTVIGVVATNAKLTKEQANKMARVGQDGIAMSVRPSHTMFDGDTVFAMATEEAEGDFTTILTLTSEVAARAIQNAVLK
ncbi:MAG: P1 family peptidase [Eubacteriales bacterium]